MQFRLRRLTVSWLLAALPCGAEAQTWIGTGGNANVSTAGNWNPAAAPASGSATDLSFSTASASTVNFDNAYTLNSMTFSGTSSYSINGTGGGATLTIGTGGIASTASVGVNFNNSLTLSGAATISTTSANLFLSAINNGGFNLTLSSASGTQSVLVNGNITGAGGLTATGTGVTFLLGTGNTYGGGTTINSGASLQIGDPGGTSPGSLPGNVANNGTINFKPVNTSFTYSGVISGSGSLNMLGSNTLTLAGANLYGGSTSVGAGTLQIGVANALPVTTTLNLSGGTLDVAYNQTIDHFSGGGSGTFITLQNGTTFKVNAASGSTSSSYAGIISGGGALVINGAANSKLTLSGANTFGGGTTIQSGRLIVKNSTGSGLGTGAVTVNSGGSLEGSGSFTGPLTLNSGSAILPDGTLKVGTTTINGGATYFWQLANATGAAGTDWGLLNLNSNSLTLSATSGNQITIKPVTFVSVGGSKGSAANFDTTVNYSWSLTSGVSSLSGFTDSTQFLVDTSAFANPFTGTFSVGTSGNNLMLNYAGGSPIPEPAVAGLLAGLAGLAFAARRRKHVARV